MNSLYKRDELATPVGYPTPFGTKTSPNFYPYFGAVFPTPFVDFFPSGSKFA